jgi:hypothetical protein
VAGRRARAAGKTAPIFGRYLRALRLRRGKRKALGPLAEDLTAAGYAISRTTLFRYEDEGTIPDVFILEGFAVIHRQDSIALRAGLLAELHGTISNRAQLEAVIAAATSARSVTESSQPVGRLASSKGNSGQVTKPVDDDMDNGEVQTERAASSAFELPTEVLRRVEAAFKALGRLLDDDAAATHARATGPANPSAHPRSTGADRKTGSD